MKAHDLANKLLALPDEFDVTISLFEADLTSYGMSLRKYNVVGIGDIGYSDRVIQLEVDREG